MRNPRVSCTNSGHSYSVLHMFVVLLLLLFEIILSVLVFRRHRNREREMFPVLDL